MRDRALLYLAIDNKLGGCDVIKVKIGDVVSGGSIRNRVTVVQQKTGRTVQFEFMTDCRKSLFVWLERRGRLVGDFVFPSRLNCLRHLGTRQYARLVDEWMSAMRACTTSHLPTPTSAGHKPSSNNAKGSSERLSNIGACSTPSSPPNINPTDEAIAPLIYPAISAKCSDDGHFGPELTHPLPSLFDFP